MIDSHTGDTLRHERPLQKAYQDKNGLLRLVYRNVEPMLDQLFEL